MVHQSWLDWADEHEKKNTKRAKTNPVQKSEPASASPPQMPKKTEPVPLKPIPGLAQAATASLNEISQHSGEPARKKTRTVRPESQKPSSSDSSAPLKSSEA